MNIRPQADSRGLMEQSPQHKHDKILYIVKPVKA